ncbi:thiolase family protein [Alkalihalobacterium alkalinitrilicum]|uniref:thiolase family protein n=1 Tax=Alkalihalobacterium alkalinitrilicum TaxID=427920 RepID=UPI0009958C28|nr:thiolase family protein [Alkalihalobacterium alkalinitrilicum]
MREVVVIEAVRTPLGKKGGVFSNIRSDELAASVLKEVVKRAGIEAEMIEDVIMGCVTQVGEQAADIGRLASLLAGFPIEVPGTTVDRQCGSSQQAIHFASQAILSGDMDVVIAAGIENMTRVPMFSNFLGPVNFHPNLTSQFKMTNQGLSAEWIAEKWEIRREEMDEFAYESHQKAIRAINEKRFETQILPVEVLNQAGERETIIQDSGPRFNTSLEKLSTLSPVFKEGGKIHAGNSSQISDGASAVLLMEKQKAIDLGLNPKFKVLARTVIGSDPTLMLTGPITATEKILKRTGLSIDDIDIYEVNEAFASIPLAWLKETGAKPEKLNPNGGAIALGHPLGASGTRLFTTLIHELERTSGRYGLQTICEGHGMANATIIERIV